MSLYQNKYRIESTRLKEWDYKNPWWYYVTINTKNHVQWFGKIKNGKMFLSPIGEIIVLEWERTKTIRKNIDLDCFVVMPNHLHGIIIINENVETTGSVVSNNANKNETMHRIVSTTLQSNSLGSIIGQIKSICSKQIHALGYKKFAWQERYYERIIRNEKELYNIRKYIEENPMRWEYEKNTLENLDIYM